MEQGGNVDGKKRFTFTRAERIRHRRDFHRVFRHGKRRHTDSFVVISHPNTLQYPRLGMAVGKKVGTAVKRNRVKRYLREFFRLHKHQLTPGQDVVIVAKPRAAGLNYRQVCQELTPVLVDHHNSC